MPHRVQTGARSESEGVHRLIAPVLVPATNVIPLGPWITKIRPDSHAAEDSILPGNRYTYNFQQACKSKPMMNLNAAQVPPPKRPAKRLLRKPLV